MNNASPVTAFDASARRSSCYYNGASLKPGVWVRLIASGTGEVVDGDVNLLVTDQVDKKGNRLLVNTTNGGTLWARPTSIWST